MAEIFDTFEKRHDFLICVDSDGCAMDTMDIKHFRCFGPCMVHEWELEQWQEPILARWNEINLYSMTRGVNRFKGLAIALAEIDQQYKTIPGLSDLIGWVDQTKALSNSALEQAIRETGSECLQKALHWSQQVNASINQLDESLKKPFDGASQGPVSYTHLSSLPSAFKTSVRSKRKVEKPPLWVPSSFPLQLTVATWLAPSN